MAGPRLSGLTAVVTGVTWPLLNVTLELFNVTELDYLDVRAVRINTTVAQVVNNTVVPFTITFNTSEGAAAIVPVTVYNEAPQVSRTASHAA